MGRNRGDRGKIDIHYTHIHEIDYPGLVSSSNMENKRPRVPKWQSKIDNSEKLATHGTQDEEKTKQKHNAICVAYHYPQTRH
jgi:hypothetical protein